VLPPGVIKRRKKKEIPWMDLRGHLEARKKRERGKGGEGKGKKGTQ